MASTPRHRKGKVSVTSTKLPSSRNETQTDSFHWSLWTLLCAENWILDFGRPIFALLVTSSFPLSLPSIGDYCHIVYNVATALVLMKLLQSSLTPVPKILQNLLVIFFIMGASIHLVGDSFNHRLIHCGYQLHLSVRENPIIKNMGQPCLVNSFELMYFYDEQLGHLMWYIPLFGTYLVYFFGCFSPKPDHSMAHSSIFYYLLISLSALYNWYLVTEGQLFEVFLITLFLMLLIAVYYRSKGCYINSNGKFLLLMNCLTFFIVGLWVLYLWDDAVLRNKYPGLLYVPEPWAYWSLYHMNN